MKSEHRHELQTNELGKFADQAWAWFEKHGNRVMVAVCATALVSAGLIYWTRSTRARDERAWYDLANASSSRKAEDFAAVWESHPGTVVAQWARLQEGEARLAEGNQLLFRNLESARKELQQAKETLQATVDEKSAPAAIRERALFALGRCLESLSDGNEGEAVKAYQSLLREFPASIFKADVEQRLAALESPGGRAFYAWFASYPRPKAPEKRPRDRTSFDNEILMDDLDDETSAGTSPDSGAATKAADGTESAPKFDLPGDDSADAATDDEPPGDESSATPPQ
ncbi:MAG: tetratricopeptide repeat protein [Planctomycetaceae bacterium]